MNNKLSVIIPSFNEEERIKDTLDNYCSCFSRYEGDWEIIVVMDGCNDHTTEIVSEFSKKRAEVRFLKFPERLGKGGAFLASLPFAEGDLIGYIDADGSSGASELIKLITYIKSGRWEGVIGSRWVEGAEITEKQRFFRRFLSRGLNVSVRVLFGLKFKDTQCGAKVFKRALIESCLPYINVRGFMFDVNLLYVATRKGFRIKEVPLKWKNVPGSKVGFGNVLRMFWDMCGLWLESWRL
jgi:glycosyltransferase involved in cell wall biosynthesis